MVVTTRLKGRQHAAAGTPVHHAKLQDTERLRRAHPYPRGQPYFNDPLHNAVWPVLADNGIALLEVTRRNCRVESECEKARFGHAHSDYEPCLWHYFCKDWGLCRDWQRLDEQAVRTNIGPPAAAFPLPRRDCTTRKAILGSRRRRKDIYRRGLRDPPPRPRHNHVCNNDCGTLTVDRSCDVDDRHKHLRLPMYAFKPVFATLGEVQWKLSLKVLAHHSLHIYESRFRVAGKAPLAGQPDERYLKFPSFMVFPCKEQDFASFPQQPLGPIPRDTKWRPVHDPLSERNPGSSSRHRLLESLIHHGSYNKNDNGSLADQNFIKDFGVDVYGRDLTQLFAEDLKKKTKSWGGPRFLLIGPQVMHWNKMKPPRAGNSAAGNRPNERFPDRALRSSPRRWEQRLEERIKPTVFDWTKMPRLEVLVIDFFDIRLSLIDPQKPATLDQANRWIENTLRHIHEGLKVAETWNWDKDRNSWVVVKFRGLRRLVLSGLRTRTWDHTVPNGPLNNVDPYPPRQVPGGPQVRKSHVHLAEHADTDPWGASNGPNWIKIARGLLKKDEGELILADFDMDMSKDRDHRTYPWNFA